MVQNLVGNVLVEVVSQAVCKCVNNSCFFWGSSLQTLQPIVKLAFIMKWFRMVQNFWLGSEYWMYV